MRLRGLHRSDEEIECVRHGPRLHRLASWISIVVLPLLRRHAPSRERDADAADGIAVFIGIRTSHAGDGHSEIGGRVRQGALGHRRRHRGAHRPLLGQQLLRNAKSSGLVLFDISDEAAMQTVRRAGRLGKQGREFACCAGFGGDERKVLLTRKLQGAATS